VEHGDALPSLDSYLCGIDYPGIQGAVKAVFTGSATGTRLDQSILHATVPSSHAKFGGYLVTRLDGYTKRTLKG